MHNACGKSNDNCLLYFTCEDGRLERDDFEKIRNYDEAFATCRVVTLEVGYYKF